MIRPIAFLSMLAAAACGGSSKSGGGHSDMNPCGGAADPCGGAAMDPCAGMNPCSGTVAMADFSDWQSFEKVSPKPFLSKGHGKKYVDVYVEPSVVQRYRAGGSGAYPVGVRLVKVQYESEAGDRIGALTVMKKMEDGYDPDNGNWFYGVYGPDGSKAMQEGKLDMCINCHDQASDNDYVFGKVN